MDTSWARNQKAVYWARLSPDGYGGWDYDDPVEIDVRWDETQEIIRDDKGEEFASRAQILVDQDMSVGDYLMLGELDDWDSSASAEPLSRSTAYPIKRFDKIPDIMAESYIRTAWL
jgi:hypothetical protein